MRIELDGPAPAWVAACSDDSLRSWLGRDTHARGAEYARQRAVLTMKMHGDGRLLHATVRGSRSHSYEAVVSAVPGRNATTGWRSSCTCPMQADCKHVAAALLTARQWLRGRASTPATADWEAQLADVVRPREPADPGLAPLALQVELTAADHYTRTNRLRLRPVTQGRHSRWVRTGASWRDLETGYGGRRHRPDHREALLVLAVAARARQPYSYSDRIIHLDDLGRQVWSLLSELTDAGVQLVSARAGQQVRVEGPARLVLDVRREHAGLQVTSGLQLPGRELPAGEPVLVGAPAHGLFVDAGPELVLAAFDRPLDPSWQRMLGQAPIHVPEPDVPRFLGGYYPVLRRRATVLSGDASVELPTVQPPRIVLDVTFEPGHRTCLAWAFAYGDEADPTRFPLRGGGSELRDPAAERALLDGLRTLAVLPGLSFPATDGGPPSPDDQVLTGVDTALFVGQCLPELQRHEGLTVHVHGRPADYAEALDSPLISVSARDAADGSTDWFDLEVSVAVAGEQVPLGPLIAALALGEQQLILDSGTWFRLDRAELQALRRVIEEARELQDGAAGLQVTLYQAGLWEELVSLGVVEHQSERWRQTVGALLDLDELPRPEPPRALSATLRPYQLDGYRWLSLLWDCRLGGILADDMGLGKTVQTLAMAARAAEQGTLGGAAGPLLIVAPTSVVGTWAAQAAAFCPELVVAAVTETQARSGRALAEAAAGAHLVVTSYALLRIDEAAYRELTWSGLVLDEAQFVKNHQAKTYQCARRLPAPFKLAITGTPLENSLMDLWSMLSITAPGLFPSPATFTDTYRRPIESGAAPEQLATLRRRIRPLLLRRTKDQVAPELPPKIEQILEVTLNPQHRRVYDQHLQRERQRVLGLLDDLQHNRIAILRSLTVLRQLSLDPTLVGDRTPGSLPSSKIDALLEQLREVVDEGHRVLVFSQFTQFLTLVRNRLDTEGIGYCYLDGRTRNRPKRVAEFTDGTAPVFLISLKAGGVGLTLTEADYVFVLDPWWNPATEAQAVDRTHRIGQTKPVMVYRLVSTGTIEEKVVALQRRKKDLFDRVVGDDGTASGALTAEDIRGLFS